jgi:hypothetical protein
LGRRELEEVAKVYRDAYYIGVKSPTEEVAKDRDVSRTQAGRYVAAARAAGLLPATTKGKKKA